MDPSATAIQNGTGIAELDISSNGSRILIGQLVATDAAGNAYYHLYMHVGGSATSIDLTPGASDGVLYDGMSADGTKVYFTTRDALATAGDQDSDSSADIYRADVSNLSASLARVSVAPGEPSGGVGDTDSCDPSGNSYNNEDWNTIPGGPTDCSAVAIGGGGGVAAGSGAIYFLSPERLDGNGTPNAPNLFYAKPGQAPHFVATLESSANAPLKPKEHLFQRSSGPFSYPEGVAFDRASGSYYVLDTLATSGSDTDDPPDGQPNYEPGAFVQKFDSSGERDLTFGDNSKLDGSASIKGPFLESGVGFGGSPVGVATQVAVDNSGGSSNGDLYVPDFINGVVDKFSPTGHFLANISTGFPFGAPPTGVAVNQKNGNVYMVTPFPAPLVYRFTSSGSPTGSPSSFSVNGTPLGIGVDAEGNSYVVNGDDTSLYNSSGAFVKVFDSNPSYGVTVDPGANLASSADDHVYVDEGNQVVEFDLAGNIVATIHLGIHDDSVSLAADSGRLAISDPGQRHRAHL